MKTLVVMTYKDVDRNVQFFKQFGLVALPDTNFALVHNNEMCDKTSMMLDDLGVQSKVYSINRPNVSQDWGGYMSATELCPPHDFYLFLNSTMRGPFVSAQCSDWVDLFRRPLVEDAELGLFGSSINDRPSPHVQSMAFILRAETLKLLFQEGVFWHDHETRVVAKNDLIYEHEVAMSQVVLKAGLNIGSLLPFSRGRDYRRETLVVNGDVWGSGAFIPHPLETVFIKTNRPFGEAVRLYTDLWENRVSDAPRPVKLRRGGPGVVGVVVGALVTWFLVGLVLLVYRNQ